MTHEFLQLLIDQTIENKKYHEAVARLIMLGLQVGLDFMTDTGGVLTASYLMGSALEYASSYLLDRVNQCQWFKDNGEKYPSLLFNKSIWQSAGYIAGAFAGKKIHEKVSSWLFQPKQQSNNYHSGREREQQWKQEQERRREQAQQEYAKQEEAKKNYNQRHTRSNHAESNPFKPSNVEHCQTTQLTDKEQTVLKVNKECKADEKFCRVAACKVFSLNPDAAHTEKNVKKIFFKLMKLWHPDKNKNCNEEKVNTESENINNAYEILSRAFGE